MYSYKIKFIVLNDSITFEMKSPYKFEVEEFVQDLLSIFIIVSEDNKPIIYSLQEYSENKKKHISEFTNKYSTKLPQLKALAAFFNKLKPNESFFFLPNIELELSESLKIKDYLKAINAGIEYDTLTDKTIDVFGDLISKYHLGVVGDQRVLIGEKERNKRFCRFCHNKRQPTTFNNKAHAISEALGNKTVILCDECDGCNKVFSETIEPDIIQALSLFRTFFKVKGKGGEKKFKGKNFDLKNEEQLNLHFYSLDDRPIENDEEYNVYLNTERPIISQNIYKALCKYFLSVIDEKHLCHFEKTIDWINGKVEIEKLPSIAEMTSYHTFSTQPKLIYYIRKNNYLNIPFAVGEFHFTCKIFVFIIPFSNQNDRDFIAKNDFEVFWNTFTHFEKSKGWIFNDYSNNNAREFTINLNFKLKK